MAEALMELIPKRDRILHLSNAVDTYSLQKGLAEHVYSAFRCLAPLRRGLKYVGSTEHGYLYVGRWLKLRGAYARRGPEVRDEGRFFEIITSYGDLIGPHVRRQVRGDFSRLVDATRRLEPYASLRVSVEVPGVLVYVCSYSCASGRLGLRPLRVSAVELETASSRIVRLLSSAEYVCINVSDTLSLVALEDVVDYVVELYEEADRRLSRRREHNERVMEEVEEVVAPYRVAASLLGEGEDKI